MVYTPKYITQQDIVNKIDHITVDPNDIPLDAIEVGEGYVDGFLLENGRFTLIEVNVTDFRLKHAATFFTLYELQNNPSAVLRGIFGMSGEIITKGAAGIQTIMAQSGRGEYEFVPQEIDRTQKAPGNWNKGMFWMRLFLKGSDTGGRRIDTVMARTRNFREQAVTSVTNAIPIRSFKPKL